MPFSSWQPATSIPIPESAEMESAELDFAHNAFADLLDIPVVNSASHDPFLGFSFAICSSEVRQKMVDACVIAVDEDPARTQDDVEHSHFDHAEVASVAFALAPEFLQSAKADSPTPLSLQISDLRAVSNSFLSLRCQFTSDLIQSVLNSTMPDSLTSDLFHWMTMLPFLLAKTSNVFLHLVSLLRSCQTASLST